MSRRLRRVARPIALVAGIFLLLGSVGLAIINPRLTRYVESDGFRSELGKQTAKGLHFQIGNYMPIRRTSLLTASSDGFRADNGRKALTALDAHEITGTFNPFGVFLRRWQLDDLHIQSGEVAIQTYEPAPEPVPSRPWYHIFLPNRVYLRRVRSEPINVTWRFRNEKGGFFGTRLLITPHGRDFNYRATGGTLKLAVIPDLPLKSADLLITKKLLTLHTLDMAAGPEGDGVIHVEGTAGIGESRSIDCRVKFDQLPIREWLPGSWKDHVEGGAKGDLSWKGKNTKLESASIQGSLIVEGGRIRRLPFLQNLASITAKKSIETLELNECSAKINWESPALEIRDIRIEEKGKLCIEGLISFREKTLRGAIQLGAAREYLEWLPDSQEVFTTERDGYLWTTVNLWGSIERPQQDLSPRVMEAFKESPGAFLGLMFRQIGGWLKAVFDGE